MAPVRLSMARAASTRKHVDWMLSDHDGTQERALELGHLMTRLAAEGASSQLQLTCPAISFDVLGAATGAVASCLATSAWKRHWALARDMGLVQELIAASPKAFRDGHEHEADWAFARALHGLVSDSPTADELPALLDRCAAVGDEMSAVRANVLRSILDQSQAGFDEAFSALLAPGKRRSNRSKGYRRNRSTCCR